MRENDIIKADLYQVHNISDISSTHELILRYIDGGQVIYKSIYINKYLPCFSMYKHINVRPVLRDGDIFKDNTISLVNNCLDNPTKVSVLYNSINHIGMPEILFDDNTEEEYIEPAATEENDDGLPFGTRIV